MPKPHLRLTFNQAAGPVLFKDGLSLRLRMEGRSVWLMGVTLPQVDDLQLEPRPRAGSRPGPMASRRSGSVRP